MFGEFITVDTIYLVILAVSAAISLGLTIYAWLRYRERSGLPFAVLMTMTTVAIIAYTGVALSDTSEGVFEWTKMRISVTTLLPSLYFVFVAWHVGQRRWLYPDRIVLLGIVPFLTALFLWVEPLQSWYFVHWEIAKIGIISVENFEFSLWHIVILIYSYLIAALTIAFLTRRFVHSPNAYRVQVKWIALGALTAIILNLLNLIIPQTALPPLAPLSLTLVNIALVWALYRYRFLNLTPMAFEQVIHYMSDALIVIDLESRVVDLNPAAERLLGVTKEQVIGSRLDQAESSYRAFVQAFDSMIEAHVELAAKSSGQFFDVHISPVFQRKTLAGRTIMIRNITDRKRAEQERERLINDLESYSHTVAHDVKNPLSTIVGYAQMLEEANPRDVEFMHPWGTKIYEAAHRITTIVDDLLLMARVSDPKDVPRDPLDMRAIVNIALVRLESDIQRAGAQVVLPDKFPHAMGYAPLVEQIWVNYLSNALKYGGDPPRLEIGGVIEGNQARFWVRDNGQGLTEEEKAKLFQQFVRLDPQRAKGTGLGLSIVQRIAEKLGGSAGVDSVEGGGSTFYFTLPCVDVGSGSSAVANDTQHQVNAKNSSKVAQMLSV
jgi:PAS domain S-box-containing protein